MTVHRLLAGLKPRRTIRPTRDGWWCLGASIAVGFAAMNTGNNLLYLLASLLLALIIVSGVLSEQSMRGLRVSSVQLGDVHAGRPAAVGVRVENGKRRLPSYSIVLETPAGRRQVGRLGAGETRVLTWEETFPRRGRHARSGVRVTTRFPFGLFLKAGRWRPAEEILVFPAVHPVAAPRPRAASAAADARRRGRGHDLWNLRDYRTGDEPRLIHWRSSAKTGALTVRELGADAIDDARIVLVGGGGDDERRERGIAEAASLAAALLAGGAAVELAGPGLHVPPGRGRAHVRRILTALALYEPSATGTGDAAAAAPSRSSPGPAEVRVSLE